VLETQLNFTIGKQKEGFGSLDKALEIAQKQKETIRLLDMFEQTIGLYRNYTRGAAVIPYAETYMKLAEKDTTTFFKTNLALASEILGLNLYKNGEGEKAIEMLKKARDNYDAVGHDLGKTQTLILLGELYRQQNLLELALSHYLQAFAIVEQKNDKAGMGVTRKLIAETYILQNNLEKGLYYANLSSQDYQELGSPVGIALSYGTLNKLYDKQGNYDSALYYAKAAVEIDRSINPQYYMIPQDLSSVGKILTLMGRYQEALTYLKEADEIHRANGTVSGQMVTTAYLADVYFKLGNYSLASKNAKEVLERSLQANQQDGVLYAFELLTEINEKRGNYKQAFKYHQDYLSLKDSMFNEQQTQKIADLEAKFKYEKEAAQDSIRNAEKEKVIMAQLAAEQAQSQQKQQQLYFSLVGLIILLGLAGFIYTRYRLIQQQKDIIENQKSQVDKKNEENELLLKEIHHRVKNNLQIISSLLNLQTKSTEDEAALAAMTDGQNRVKAMALIHQGLYQQDKMADISEYLSWKASGIHGKSRRNRFRYRYCRSIRTYFE